MKALSKQVGEARRSGDAGRRRRAGGTQPGARARRNARVGAVADAAQEEVRRALLLPAQPSRRPRPPTAPGPRTTWWSGRGRTPAPSYTDAQRVPHWEIGAELGLLDMERGAKLSGSMFPLYRGFGARLLRALTSFALDRHADEFEEVRPPTMVLTETMVSTGHLPKFEEDAYHIERDDLWAIPTAEVPLTSMWRGDILDEADLPLRLTAATACFRREAGAAGRDTRGLLRVHEFDKVELFAYATPDQAPAMLESMVARAEATAGGPRPPVPGPRPVRRRHGQLRGPDLRPRGLLPRGRPVAGGLLGQLVHRLPGPPGQHPLPAGRRRRARCSSTPSTARRWPGRGSGRRWWRPAGRRTVRWSCPRCWLPTCGVRWSSPPRVTGARAARPDRDQSRGASKR